MYFNLLKEPTSEMFDFRRFFHFQFYLSLGFLSDLISLLNYTFLFELLLLCHPILCIFKAYINFFHIFNHTKNCYFFFLGLFRLLCAGRVIVLTGIFVLQSIYLELQNLKSLWIISLMYGKVECKLTKEKGN